MAARKSKMVSEYTTEKARAICDLIIDGKSLRQICRRQDMPPRRTVFHWLEREVEFQKMYALAREMQGDFMDERIVECADATNKENSAAMRVKILAYQWRAEKLAPHKYGNRIVTEHAGKIFVSNPKDDAAC